MKHYVTAFLAVFTLAGCGDGPFTVNSDNSLVKNVMPGIRKACPGLDRYSSQFENVRVENLYRTTVVFDIPDSAKIPPTFNAAGNSCFVEIAPDGKTIYIEKAACKSICLERTEVPAGQLQIPISNS